MKEIGLKYSSCSQEQKTFFSAMKYLLKCRIAVAKTVHSLPTVQINADKELALICGRCMLFCNLQHFFQSMHFLESGTYEFTFTGDDIQFTKVGEMVQNNAGTQYINNYYSQEIASDIVPIFSANDIDYCNQWCDWQMQQFLELYPYIQHIRNKTINVQYSLIKPFWESGCQFDVKYRIANQMNYNILLEFENKCRHPFSYIVAPYTNAALCEALDKYASQAASINLNKKEN